MQYSIYIREVFQKLCIMWNYRESSNKPPARLLESLLLTERGMGVYKRLECSQSIFEKPNHSACFYHFSTMFSYCMNFCIMFFWQLNKEFAKIIQKIRSFCPMVFQWVFIRGWYFAEKCLKKWSFLESQLGGGCLLEHGHLLEFLRYIKFVETVQA